MYYKTGTTTADPAMHCDSDDDSEEAPLTSNDLEDKAIRVDAGKAKFECGCIPVDTRHGGVDLRFFVGVVCCAVVLLVLAFSGVEIAQHRSEFLFLNRQKIPSSEGYVSMEMVHRDDFNDAHDPYATNQEQPLSDEEEDEDYFDNIDQQDTEEAEFTEKPVEDADANDKLIEIEANEEMERLGISLVEAPYVVNLGLPKTGTSSLRDQFSKLRFKATHYMCNAKKSEYIDRKAWSNMKADEHNAECIVAGNRKRSRCAAMILFAVREGRRPFDYVAGEAMAQMDCVRRDGFYFPQVDLLDDIYQSYSKNEIVFTMSTRPTVDWVASVKDWGTLARRFIVTLNGTTHGDFTFPTVPLHYSWEEGAAFLQVFKDYHENRVRTYAREKGYLLLEFNIGDESGLSGNFTKLAKYVHKTAKNLKYNWANSNNHAKHSHAIASSPTQQTPTPNS